MLYTILNTQNDHNLDTFSKAVIYKASDFSKFDRFTSDEDLTASLSNINSAASVLFLDLLPENLTVNHPTILKNTSTTYRTNISCIVTPQTKDVQQILAQFNNKEVFVLLQKENTQHLYGSTKEPLVFTFNELHNQRPGKLQGYTISITGTTIEQSRFIDINEFNIVSRLLSSPLASAL